MEHDDAGLIRPEEQTLTYDRYLKINELLNLQQELSSPKEHDETLFIIIHQVYELWFKQILHEVERCQATLKSGQLVPMLRSLKRIDTIQKVLIHQIDVLETMAPNEFNRFRDRLNPASGFQSHQFRILEFTLGLKDHRYLKFFEHEPSTFEKLASKLKQPSLYDNFLHYLKAQKYPVPEDVLQRDLTTIHEPSQALTEMFAEIYQNHEKHYELYMICEALVDLDEQLMIWRYRHVVMVQRMIGDMKGTGGSQGARYLQQTLQKRAFPELWQVRNHLGQKTAISSSHSS
ncbi:MAG: tryptophan 2,3-dioxygenase [Oligoflexus sp.]